MLRWKSVFAPGGTRCLVAVLCCVRWLWRLRTWLRQEIDNRRRTQRRSQLQALITQRQSESQSRLKQQLLDELREFQDLDGSLRYLFRQLCSSWGQHFALLIDLRDGRRVLLDSRGVSEKSRHTLALDDEFITEETQRHGFQIENRRLHGSKLLASLTLPDRRKAQALYAVFVRHDDAPVALLLTTRLFAVTDDRAQQLAFTADAFAHLAGFLQPAPHAEADDAVQLSAEIRRDVPASEERDSSTPLAQIGGYLKYLAKSLAVDRVVLHAPQVFSVAEAKQYGRCQVNLPPRHIAQMGGT